MVRYDLDATFAALADPSRRTILQQVSRGPTSISELAEPLQMTIPGVLKHVRILEDVDLVETRKVGRTRECRLGPARLDDALGWIEEYRGRWERRLDRLERYVAKQRSEA